MLVGLGNFGDVSACNDSAFGDYAVLEPIMIFLALMHVLSCSYLSFAEIRFYLFFIASVDVRDASVTSPTALTLLLYLQLLNLWP